ncbi:integrase core domain-containing protein [Sphaerisporangium sp. NPDC088356]|uniref:integrase core domain-containing protein n=1 Tax=Sphaerisporangium sp. NPDC088356 TaxID=3154871 RepID=UPI00342C5010
MISFLDRPSLVRLWQMDIVGGVFLATGAKAKVVTGVGDHSRYCVIVAVVLRPTARAVCLAFASALAEFGIPDEVLTDNGKQFTDRFGKGGEVLFDRICRDNGIVHRLTEPRHPTTTGKVERFHQSLRRELLDDAVPFADLAAAQAAVNAWVEHYNTERPHQALEMACPIERFASRGADEDQRLLPLRLPAPLRQVLPDDQRGGSGSGFTHLQRARSHPSQETGQTLSPGVAAAGGPVWSGGPVEFDRVVPPSGNMQVAGRQFWLGPDRAGITVRFWADTRVIHLLVAGIRIKSFRSHLSPADLAKPAAHGSRPAGPSPLLPAEQGSAIEVDRTVSRAGTVSLAGRVVLAAEMLNGRRVTVRIEEHTLMFFDPATRELR